MSKARRKKIAQRIPYIFKFRAFAPVTIVAISYDMTFNLQSVFNTFVI
jgi:hypothetical protein